MSKRWLLIAFLVVPLAAMLAGQGRAGIIFGRKKDKIDPKTRVPELIATLEERPDADRRTHAAEELRNYDPMAFPDIVPALVSALQSDAKSGVRIEAAQSLGKLRPVNQTAGEALERAVSTDPAMRVRLQARSTLMQYHWAGYRNGKASDVPPLALAEGRPQGRRALPPGRPHDAGDARRRFPSSNGAAAGPGRADSRRRRCAVPSRTPTPSPVEVKPMPLPSRPRRRPRRCRRPRASRGRNCRDRVSIRYFRARSASDGCCRSSLAVPVSGESPSRLRLVPLRLLVRRQAVHPLGRLADRLQQASGGACMVMAMSRAVADISMATIASPSISPAPTPTMPTPRTRSVSGSTMIFVRPSVRSSVMARPEPAQG